VKYTQKYTEITRNSGKYTQLPKWAFYYRIRKAKMLQTEKRCPWQVVGLGMGHKAISLVKY